MFDVGVSATSAFNANQFSVGDNKVKLISAQYTGPCIGIDVFLIQTVAAGEAQTKLASLQCLRILVVHTPLTRSHANALPELLNNQP